MTGPELPEPLNLTLYFWAYPEFERLWTAQVSRCVDKVFASEAGRQIQGQPPSKTVEQILRDPVEDQVAFPSFICITPETLTATWSAYVGAEIKRRLALQDVPFIVPNSLTACTVDRPHNATECNGEHLSLDDT